MPVLSPIKAKSAALMPILHAGDHGLLMMTKEKLGYKTWPSPAGAFTPLRAVELH